MERVQSFVYRKQRDMKGTDSQFDVNFVSLVGKGVYVGDALTLLIQ